MSLKFNDAIEAVAEKLLEAPKPDFQTYSMDAAEISEKIDQELIKINSIFKGTVTNWTETAQFFNAEFPKLKYPTLRLEFPFPVEPQSVHVFSSEVFHIQSVKLKASVNHRAVENGYLNGKKLTKLFIWDLKKVIGRIPKVTCRSGKTYEVSTAFVEDPSGALLINILCYENDQQIFPTIRYQFVLYFLFTNKSFGYTYVSNLFHQFDDSAFDADMKHKAKVVQSVQILLQLLVPNQSILSMQMALKIININKYVIVGSALLEAIPRCIPYLRNLGSLKSSYIKLLRFKQSDSVQLTELMEVFGLK